MSKSKRGRFIVCKQCFKLVVAYSWNQVYCSRECYLAHGKDVLLVIQQRIDAVRKEKICCEICGYNKWKGCLEWHHVYPNEKSFIFAGIASHTNEEIEAEYKKCVLLCCNCHQEVHRGREETIDKVFDIMEKRDSNNVGKRRSVSCTFLTNG